MWLTFSLLFLFLTTATFITQAQKTKSTNSSSSSKKNTLQSKYDALLNDIKVLEKNLSKTSTEKKESMQQLQAISKKVDMRIALIHTINEQILVLTNEINEKNNHINAMSSELNALKKEYASSVRFIYSTIGNTGLQSYMLAASNFRDAYNRYIIYRRYSEYIETQAQKISNNIIDLNEKIAALNQSKAEKNKVVLNEKEQKAKLEIEKKQKDILVKKLAKDEAKIKTEVAKKNKEAKELNAQIQKIIEKEIAEAKKRAATSKAKSGTAKTTTPSKSTAAAKTTSKTSDVAIDLTPAELTLSNDFESNKGKLPWPVEKGAIISTFGRHKHEFLNEVIVENNGIDIKTASGAGIRCLFEGTVISVFYMSFNQNSVIVKHGEYFTVYSNLKSVNVKIGSKVSTKQIIGTAYTNPADGLTSTHLELWKGKLKLDPALWIRQ